MRVLVVDDEVRNAELVALGLRDAGHDTAFVNGGKSALEKLAQPKSVPDPGAPASLPKPKKQKGEAPAANAEETEGKAQDMPAAQGEQAVPEGA